MADQAEAANEDEVVRAKEALNASWKMLTPQLDGTARTSVSQEEHAYIEPAAGTIPTKFRYASGVFGQYIDKAVKLKVNLKSTAH